MSIVLDGNLQYLSATPPFRGGNISAAIWVIVTFIGQEQKAFAVWDDIAADLGNEWLITVQATGVPLVATHQTGPGSVKTAAGPGAITAGVWQHLVLTNNASGNLICYLNGTAGSPTASAATQSTSALMTVGGGLSNGTMVNPLHGKIAGAALWDVELSAAEVLALAQGAPPKLVRPQSLKFNLRAERQAIDLVAATAMTMNASPTVDDTYPIVVNP